MWRSAVCILLALSLTSTGAVPTRKQMQEALIQHLLGRRNETPVMQFNEKDFNYFMNHPYRDCSLFLLYLSRLKTGQQMCEHCAYEFGLVANSFVERYGDDADVFFAVIDIDLFPNATPTDIATFRTPPLGFYPGAGEKPLVVRIRDPWVAEDVALWIGWKVGRKIFVVRPGTSWMAWAMKGLLVVPFVFIYWDTVAPCLKDNNKLAVAAMIFCFAMSSGQMFNFISSVRVFGQGDGLAGFLMSSWGQSLAETVVVMVMYAGISLSFIAITDFTVGTGCRTYCNVVTSIAVATIVLFFSVLVWMVKYRNSGYSIRFGV